MADRRHDNHRFRTVAVCCHDAAYGPPHHLRDHLRSIGTERVVFIGHVHRAVADGPPKTASLQIFERSESPADGCSLKRERRSRLQPKNELVGYACDFLRTIWWGLFCVPGTIDLFVGAGNLNALAGIVLRAFGKVRRVAYYVIDYIPERFPNPVVNAVYNRVEKWAARWSDITWNYSNVMIQRRSEKWGGRFSPQIVTPHGSVPRWHERDREMAVAGRQLVYFGFINRHQGCGFVIDAMPEIRRLFPDASLLMIGQCDAAYQVALDRTIAASGLQEAVAFTGMIPSHDDAERLLLRASIAVAMYADDHPFIRNADPGKVKSYLACGLPIVMTHVGDICDRIVAADAGVVVPYDRAAFVDTICRLLGDESRLVAMSEHAGRLSENYRWSAIFADALAAVP